MRYLLLAIGGLAACTSPVEYKPCGGRVLSYVAKPAPQGAPCMFDRPELLYWSLEGITAAVWDDDKRAWVYHTYSWEQIGVDASKGKTTFGIYQGRFFFPGVCTVSWRMPDPWESAH